MHARAPPSRFRVPACPAPSRCNGVDATGPPTPGRTDRLHQAVRRQPTAGPSGAAAAGACVAAPVSGVGRPGACRPTTGPAHRDCPGCRTSRAGVIRVRSGRGRPRLVGSDRPAPAHVCRGGDARRPVARPTARPARVARGLCRRFGTWRRRRRRHRRRRGGRGGGGRSACRGDEGSSTTAWAAADDVAPAAWRRCRTARANEPSSRRHRARSVRHPRGRRRSRRRSREPSPGCGSVRRGSSCNRPTRGCRGRRGRCRRPARFHPTGQTESAHGPFHTWRT